MQLDVELHSQVTKIKIWHFMFLQTREKFKVVLSCHVHITLSLLIQMAAKHCLSERTLFETTWKHWTFLRRCPHLFQPCLQTISTELSQHETENWAERYVNISVVCRNVHCQHSFWQMGCWNKMLKQKFNLDGLAPKIKTEMSWQNSPASVQTISNQKLEGGFQTDTWWLAEGQT